MTASARHPLITILLVLATSLGMSITAISRIEVKLDSAEVSVSQTSYPVRQRNWVHRNFPPDFVTTFLLRPQNNAVEEKLPPNAVSIEAIRLQFDLYQAVLQEIGAFDYPTLENDLRWFSITNLWNNNRTEFEAVVGETSEAKALQAYLTDHATDSMLKNFLGKPVFSTVTSYNNTTPQLFVQGGASWRSHLAMTWRGGNIRRVTGRSLGSIERSLVPVANNITSRHWVVDALNERTLSDNLEEPVFRDLPLVYGAFGIMALFTGISFSCRRSAARGCLGVGAVVTVLLSVITGYGVCVHAGIPITMMTQVLVSRSLLVAGYSLALQCCWSCSVADLFLTRELSHIVP